MAYTEGPKQLALVVSMGPTLEMTMVSIVCLCDHSIVFEPLSQRHLWPLGHTIIDKFMVIEKLYGIDSLTIERCLLMNKRMRFGCEIGF